MPRQRVVAPGLLLALGLALGSAINCGGGSGDSQELVCRPGAAQPCTGDLGCTGQATCALDGLSLGACDCSEPGPDASSAGGAGLMQGSGGAAGNAGSNLDGGSDPVTGDPDAATIKCEDDCDPDQPSVCLDGNIRSCWIDPISGCPVDYSFECAQGGCGDENHCVVCNHECDSLGASGCLHGQLGTCVRSEQGCLVWQASEACSSGFCGDDASCGTCDHGCDTAGDVECLNGESRVCVADAFGCRSWWPWSECPTLQCESSTQCWLGSSVGQRGTSEHDEADALALDGVGNTATVGQYHRYGALKYRPDTDAFLQVRDASDTLVKDVVFGSDADDGAMAVAVDTSGNHLVAGWTTGRMDANGFKGGRDAFVAKWGEDQMEPVWIRQWGSSENDLARAVVVNAAGDVFAIGSTGGQLGDAHSGGDDWFMTKFDAVGNRLWTKQWGTSSGDVATAATIDAAGHIWVAGRTGGKLGSAASAGAYDAFAAELDGDGNLLQLRQFGTAYGDAATGIALDGSGNVFVAGVTQGALDGELSNGGIDAFVVKLADDLNTVWTRMWGTSSEDLAAAVAVDAAGGPYLAVTVQTTADLACAPGQIWAAGFDADGAPTISQSWDSCGVDTATGIAVRPDGLVLLSGWTDGDLVSESRGGRDIVSIVLRP